MLFNALRQRDIFCSGTIRAGLATEKTPSMVLPNVYSRQRSSVLPSGSEGRERRLYGDEAIADTRSWYDIRCPMQDRIIHEWNDMEQILLHILYQLRIQADEHPILVSEPPLMSKPYREKLLEFIFEEMNAPGIERIFLFCL